MKNLPAILAAFMLLAGCKPDKKDNNGNEKPTDITPTTEVKGYGLFAHICGLWAGSVSSSTALGNFPDYTADYRPISPSQVSAKNELDKSNDLFMSFFITWHCNQYKMAFRNGGYFGGMQRISYLVIDSVAESGSTAFYRFADFKAGRNRTYADMFFTNDSMYMRVYTNKNNTQPQAVMHFMWNAGRQDATAAQAATTHFNFPQKTMINNLCTAFDGKTESIFYDPSLDVYKETDHPYLGKTTVDVNLNGLTTAGKKVYLIITTKPLFNGFTPQLQNIKYKSRYVVMEATAPDFTFNYMHPGTYYLYGLYDTDGNGTFSSGDYVALNNLDLNNTFSLSTLEQKTVSLNLSYQIP